MSRIIDKGLEEQSVLLLKMGELAYETLALSLNGYLQEKNVSVEVIEMSDMLVSMADKVEDRTFELIARFQPVASDLRTIKSCTKIGNDFARYGRYALDIVTLNNQLNGLNECDGWVQDYIAEMSEKVLGMVKVSVDSLRRYDIPLAKTISQTENEVDKMYVDFLGKLIEKPQIDNRCIISSVLATRYLERIADHATYICESVVYIATGEKVNLR
jgi:phosphate transport system protein